LIEILFVHVVDIQNSAKGFAAECSGELVK